jgi:hypothetical protein
MHLTHFQEYNLVDPIEPSNAATMRLPTLSSSGLSKFASYVWLGKWPVEGDCIVQQGVHVAFMPHKSS